MLRRTPYTLGAIASVNRSARLHHVRLASFNSQIKRTKDTTPIKVHQTTTRQTSSTPFQQPSNGPNWKPNYALFIANFTKWTAVVFLSVHIFFEYFYLPSGAYGISMLPNINPSGDWLLISKYYRRGRGIAVGDLVSFQHPVREGDYAVKRVMGLEGDFVLMNTPGKSDAMIQIPEGHCWVVGDNLPHSRDSRMFGPLPMALIAGKVIARWGAQTTEWLPRYSRLDQGLQNSDESDIAVD